MRADWEDCLPFSNRAWRSRAQSVDGWILNVKKVPKCVTFHWSSKLWSVVRVRRHRVNCLSHRIWFAFLMRRRRQRQLRWEKISFPHERWTGKNICVILECREKSSIAILFRDYCKNVRKKMESLVFEKKFTTRNIDVDSVFSWRIHKRFWQHVDVRNSIVGTLFSCFIIMIRERDNLSHNVEVTFL